MAKKKEKPIEWVDGHAPVLGLGEDTTEEVVIESTEEEIIPDPSALDSEGQPTDETSPFKVGDVVFLSLGKGKFVECELTYAQNESGCFEAKIPAYDRKHQRLTGNKPRTHAVHVTRLWRNPGVDPLRSVALSPASLKALSKPE